MSMFSCFEIHFNFLVWKDINFHFGGWVGEGDNEGLANNLPITVLLTSGYGGFSVMVQSVGRQKPR